MLVLDFALVLLCFFPHRLLRKSIWYLVLKRNIFFIVTQSYLVQRRGKSLHLTVPQYTALTPKCIKQICYHILVFNNSAWLSVIWFWAESAQWVFTLFSPETKLWVIPKDLNYGTTNMTWYSLWSFVNVTTFITTALHSYSSFRWPEGMLPWDVRIALHLLVM